MLVLVTVPVVSLVSSSWFDSVLMRTIEHHSVTDSRLDADDHYRWTLFLTLSCFFFPICITGYSLSF